MFKSELILLDSKTIGMADHNTIVYEVVYSGYRQITGLLFTRYGVHAVSMMFGDGVSTGSAYVTKLSSGGSDTITATKSNNRFTFKSGSGWNNFLLVAASNSGISETPIISIYSLSKT